MGELDALAGFVQNAMMRKVHVLEIRSKLIEFAIRKRQQDYIFDRLARDIRSHARPQRAWFIELACFSQTDVLLGHYVPLESLPFGKCVG